MDNFLEFLVRAANKYNFKVDMTLNVKGSIVKGTLISAKDYFKELSKGFEDSEGIAKEIGRYMSNTGLSVAAQEVTPARFIHLKDVELIGADGQSALSDGNKLWRGRLSEVDGFNLDQDVTVETDDDDSDAESSDDSKESSQKKPDKKEEDEKKEDKKKEDKKKEDEKKDDSDEDEDDDEELFDRLDDLEDKMKGLLPDSVAGDEDKESEEEDDKKDSKKSSSKSKKSSSKSKKSSKSSSKK